MMAEREHVAPPLVFVHGWGFHNGIWHGVADRLQQYEVHHVELGFLRNTPMSAVALPSNAVCIGHSFGLMWLLKHGPKPMVGLLSVAGFDCFHAHIGTRQIEAMRRGLERDPIEQMERFWQSCGTSNFIEREHYDVAALQGGLGWLASWDERAALRALDCPLRALGSANDQIVPESMTKSIWGKGDLRLHPDGGHALPLTATQWCADEIDDFVKSITS